MSIHDCLLKLAKRQIMYPNTRIWEWEREVAQAEQSILQEIDELTKAYDDYIAFLGEELNELAPMASVHGWKSSRFEQGKKMRATLSEVRNTIRKEKG